MKNALFASLFLVSVSGFGAVKVAMELEYAGKKISPTVITASGEAATITQDDLKIEVKAKKQEGNRAVLSFKVFQKSDGNEKLLASPAVSTLWGTAAEITQGIGEEGKSLRLKVTPTIIP